MNNFGEIQCETCGVMAKKNGSNQRYCKKCSEERDRARKRLWARNYPPRNKPKPTYSREDCKRAGARISIASKRHVANASDTPELAWLVKFKVPFSYASSKNHIFTMRSQGHVALRAASRSFREAVAFATKAATSAVPVVQNKVWIDFHVEKPNHRGDAINVLDLLADGIKRGLGVDDRWFAIRKIDWSIQKNDPHIIIGIGQEECEHAQACSTCGSILPYSFFNKNAHAKTGIGRICIECRKEGREIAIASRQS